MSSSTSELAGRARSVARRTWSRSTASPQLEREAARLRRRTGQLIAAVAAGQRQDRRDRAARSSRSIRISAAKSPRRCARSTARSANSSSARSTAEDQLKRVDIRAPQDGTVFQLDRSHRRRRDHRRRSDHADRAGCRQPDRRSQGQSAGYRAGAARTRRRCCASPAFNQRPRRRSTARSRRISADTNTDQRTGRAIIPFGSRCRPDQLAKLGRRQARSGHAGRSFIQTGDRTVISYLLKPLHDQLKRTFREKG